MTYDKQPMYILLMKQSLLHMAWFSNFEALRQLSKKTHSRETQNAILDVLGDLVVNAHEVDVNEGVLEFQYDMPRAISKQVLQKTGNIVDCVNHYIMYPSTTTLIQISLLIEMEIDKWD